MTRPVLFALLSSLCCGLLLSCSDDGGHYQRALAIERELLRQDKDADYQSPRYLHVMRALKAVPRNSPDRTRATTLLTRISDARRIALNSSLPEQVDHLPTRLRGTVAAQPPRTDFSKPRPPPAASAQNAIPPAATKKTGVAERDGLQITMYSTSWCGYCRKARRWFTDNGFAFVEKDIEKSSEAAREYKAASGGYGGVPLIVVNGKSFRGFDQRALLARIREVLGSSG